MSRACSTLQVAFEKIVPIPEGRGFTTCLEEDPVTSPFPDQLSLEVAKQVSEEPRESPAGEEGSVAVSEVEEVEVPLQRQGEVVLVC